MRFFFTLGHLTYMGQVLSLLLLSPNVRFMELPNEPSLLLNVLFIGLSVWAIVFWIWWTRAWKVGFAWFVVTGVCSIFGAYQYIGPPPLLLLFLLPAFVAIAIFAKRCGWHRRSLSLIVGFQAFRIVVELAIHQAVVEGVAPPQLTWSGLNWDVATGVGALAMLTVANRLPNWALHLWNGLGAGLLMNVIVVALLSIPSPLQVLEPANIWVSFFPFSWLPLILVAFAWFGHVVLFVHLRERQMNVAEERS